MADAAGERRTCGDAGCPQASCEGLPSTCGPKKSANCCSSSVIPGGTYYRSNDRRFPATVSSFRLDVYEVTVGRFRRFVAAYSRTMTRAGAGKNPNDASDPGWDSAWAASMPADSSALTTSVKCLDPGAALTPVSWTDVPGANEGLPITCVSWYLAFAFCIWDGGRLPTEAEWNYAAAGGNEQRQYPWSDPAGNVTLDDSYAVYCGNSCAAADVGSKSPKGDGRWGQADLAGNAVEWNLDWSPHVGNFSRDLDPYSQTPCTDCTNRTPGQSRIARGGSFLSDASGLVTSDRGYLAPTSTNIWIAGVRCARPP